MKKRKYAVVKAESLKVSVNLPASVTVVNTGNYVVQKIKEENN